MKNVVLMGAKPSEWYEDRGSRFL